MDIFNPLRVFTKEPITEQEIKWECMNVFQNNQSVSHALLSWAGSIAIQCLAVNMKYHFYDSGIEH